MSQEDTQIHQKCDNAIANSLTGLFCDHLKRAIQIGESFENPSGHPKYEISGIIGMSGKVTGFAAISMPMETAKAMAAAYLHLDDVTDDLVSDCVGEIANVIFGRAKSTLESYQIAISTPKIFRSTEISIKRDSDTRCMSLPFESDLGEGQLEIALASAA